MKIYALPQKKIWHILSVLLLLALLYCSRDTLTALNILGFAKSQILTAAIIGTVGIAFLICCRKHLGEIFKDFRMVLAGIAAALLLIPMAVKQDFQTMYLSILFYILAAILLSYIYSLRDASRYYVALMTVLGAYSVLCAYFLRILPDRGILNIPTYLDIQDLYYYNFGLSQVPLEYVKMRNFGIFREPGVYQFFILLALYLNNYRADWDKPWQRWTANGILAVTMITTFATGGVLELLLLTAFLFFDKKWYRVKKARIAAYSVILLGICGAAWLVITKNTLYKELEYMILKFADPESGLTRYNAIFVDLNFFLRHPLFGADIQEVLHSVVGNSTSTMILFASLGILGGTFHVLSWGALVWDRDHGVIRNLLLLTILFMSFNTQNLTWNMMFWLFPMLGMGQRLPELLKKQKAFRK